VVPKGTITLNGGNASTSSRSVTLGLSASDPSPASGVDSIRESSIYEMRRPLAWVKLFSAPKGTTNEHTVGSQVRGRRKHG
jgi:hypothetical protein